MKILVSGAGGLIGSAVSKALENTGHEAVPLIRASRPPYPGAICWQPERGKIDRAALNGVDAVVHLAGANIARRWTARVRRLILESRVNGTRLLCETLAGLENPPATLVCASAVGFYGDRGEAWLREDSSAGSGFLADVCRQWEDACQPAREAGIRTINLRTGVVLSDKGGALPKMLGAFRVGLGGKFGNGRQFMSWITLDDIARVVLFALNNSSVSGSVNAVAPKPVTNAEFTKILGRVLHRPTILAVPGFVLRLAAGEMADQMLLMSSRVEPAQLTARGFRFIHPDLEGALRSLFCR